ncbi:ubiquitin-specific protease ubp14 [Datura stramonium]|uniref:Ubiquitin-specific protease ubp14 n=1 Tax=Datura stramonium TaxID=4076 RepID=A0ABS8TJ94_DATST|nr:ubiquitin-specific protease ubp14 [Datura stramonium]
MSAAFLSILRNPRAGCLLIRNTFLAFGRDYVGWNYEKTGNPVYLHIKQSKKTDAEDRPSKKPTLLAIGLDGGFDNSEPQYEVRLAVDAILLAEGAERKEQLASWTADKKLVSKYAKDLQQLDNGVAVPPVGWKCAKCDKTDNLWLNLTDGTTSHVVGKWDGTGGNDHAVNHYRETGYPICCKAWDRNQADLEGQLIYNSDVFSYPEDESVVDPLLAQHLAHFGIDFSSLQKLLLGRYNAGYVLNAAPFCSRTKLASWLASGKYSAPVLEKDDTANAASSQKQEGIRPRMFKSVIAASHPEFSTMRQQAVNKKELADFQNLKAERAAGGKELSATKLFYQECH